jgi:hypothetical protein
MSEFYNQDEDTSPVKEEHTWKDDHDTRDKMIKWTSNGAEKYSDDLGHTSACPRCAAGMAYDQEAQLSRDGHFKKSMGKHNTNLGKND